LLITASCGGRPFPQAARRHPIALHTYTAGTGSIRSPRAGNSSAI
jgi:hypothetical protein